MKKDIHPKIFPAIFVDLTTGAEFVSFTTRKTQETKKIGDVEYNIVKVEITSDSHPFFTGKQVILDTAGRVDKFRARMQKMKDMKAPKGKAQPEEEVAEEVVESTEMVAEEVMETTPVEMETEKKPAPKKKAATKKPAATAKAGSSTAKKASTKKK